MVPRFSTMVSLFMPMPLSEIVSVLAFSSGMILIFQSESPSSNSWFVSDWKRTVSMASLALEINSRRNMSWCEYSEWMMRWRSCFSSVLNCKVSELIPHLPKSRNGRPRRGQRLRGKDRHFVGRGRRHDAPARAAHQRHARQDDGDARHDPDRHFLLGHPGD